MARRAHDNYSTDIGLARWAVKHAARMALLPQQPTVGSMIEPCCGDEAPFAAAAKEIGMEPFGFDVREVDPPIWGKEPSKISTAGRCLPGCGIGEFDPAGETYDVIATNPPFSIGEEVVRKSLEFLSPHGAAAFLVKLAFLGTQDRSKLFKSRPPAEIWILTARPSFTGDGHTDVAQEYAFAFWHGSHTDSLVDALGMRATKLYWLDNKSLMASSKKKRVRVQKGGGDE